MANYRHPAFLHLENGVPLNERNYFQADLAVVCGEVSDDRHRPDPVLVIEIIAPSSYDHDAGHQAARYREIAGCRAILLIESERPHAIL